MLEKLHSKLASFVANKDGATIAFLISLFLVLLIGAILVVTVATEVNDATDNGNISGTITEDILDLWPFMFVLVPVIIIVKYLG